ncbi:hypothetical protein SY89_00528 [Halolamina pelagica]|uniref:Uncharacterized protein n=1 Tax=Halolamina pelagica TaxID=699431 RepID=A0A0P7H8H7_9EURY|nr:hypothetical protein [Halolamina pelagica]KPN29810.1 hypothetical protein SY89_00528 [Halolamina pelagica]
MADLQSCYFCASPDDVGEYAVVPPRLGGGDRSVALCPDCKTKLLRVMEPLIERAEAGADAGDDERVDDAAGITMDASAGSDTGGASADPADSAATGATPSTPAADDDTPPQYDRAMRMLSNRPFPVDRSEVESILANAYDLEREEIDAVLDHAVDEGRLVAEDGQLREP